MTENNCSRKVLREISEDGFTSFNGRNYSIAYDESIRSRGRVRWTLMHEIGHIYLKHFIDFKQTFIRRGSLTDDEYDILEKEAHYFAKNVLAPLPLLDKLKIKTAETIYKITGLSMEASRNRLSDLAIWKFNYRNIYDLAIIKNFHPFIHKKRCVICGHSFIYK
jgi:Zn-dependent peptidase ImmA (M78 family)